MIVYGRNPVREALRGRRAGTVSEVWSTAATAWPGAVVRSGEQIEQRCGSHAHQGVCADVGPYPYADAGELLGASDPAILALDQVQDPQNLGAICRTAECAGLTGVVICERHAAEVTPAVCKASAGAVEHLAIARVRNLADFLGDAKRAGCWCYGASADGGVPYAEPDYSGGVVMVLGGEGSGLRRRVAQSCDALISIPQRGRVASLNVSAAAAVLAYALDRAS